ncbi:proteasome assembly chaperone family protein [Cryobacterium tepidiphilum]|uniref:PAC2 family protein n=1 Tax=Cryobacterium tepidiphilum TaxID=2486026 RepID=A0A3M8LBL6_9MICO|nr:PAC2 family protein [Cryobacterium tepidiphilum]RNE62349.1 PAC2 family protein [Cryobacterium tepidiphilum]
MRNPADLYELTSDAARVPEGLHLVAGLTGFADAGGAVSQFNEYLLDSLDHTLIATFDADVLLDFRARRPVVYFDQDHLGSYQASTLELHLASDEVGQQFLFLVGFEPDFRWEQFTAAVMELVERFRVSSISWVNSIPMPVPHTRPIGVTVSGSRSDLVETMSVWRPQTQVPANALHLLEYRLQGGSLSTAGFVLLIPHYLADTEYPSAALSALESTSAATGLIFPTDRLREQNRDFTARIDEQVQENPELARLVGTLEARYDAYMEGSALRSPLTDEDGELPSADEIAAELEKFLMIRRNRDDGPPS